jgi:hypothetical protein
MPPYLGDEIGDRWGSRIITGLLKTRDRWGHIVCRWQCDCGTAGKASLKAMRNTRNCPACHPGNPATLARKHTHGHTKRGARTKLYDAWANMMQRTNPTSAGPRNRQWYAGIIVCDAWQTFEGFRDWALVNGYREGLSLERSRSSGNYEPGNCEWITRGENSRRAAYRDGWRRYNDITVANGLLSFGT